MEGIISNKNAKGINKLFRIYLNFQRIPRPIRNERT